MKAFHALVCGEVQGVGFRYSAARKAASLGVLGWVRNTDEGDVEVWAEGEARALEEFEAWLWQGPSSARVREVRLTPQRPRGLYGSFEIAFH